MRIIEGSEIFNREKHRGFWVLLLIGLAAMAIWRLGPEASLVSAQGNTKVNPQDGLTYVWIPPGTFMMGCSPGDIVCGDEEKRPHQVVITKGFWLGQTEVTVGAYKRFAATPGRKMPYEPSFNNRPLNSGWHDDTMPIVMVTWGDAKAYCGWAGGRLPTEAEWEYAARAGTTAAQYGDLDKIAWYLDNSGLQHLDSAKFRGPYEEFMKLLTDNQNGLHDVGSKLANSFGLYDMLGNVSEWVNDSYDPRYYCDLKNPSQDPPGPAKGQGHVIRGGSWDSHPYEVRVSSRHSGGSAYLNYDLGFRCAVDVLP